MEEDIIVFRNITGDLENSGLRKNDQGEKGKDHEPSAGEYVVMFPVKSENEQHYDEQIKFDPLRKAQELTDNVFDGNP